MRTFITAFITALIFSIPVLSQATQNPHPPRPGSVTREAGLRQGDVIQEANHQAVKNTSEFERAVSQAGKEPVLLLINRNGNAFFVVVEAH